VYETSTPNLRNDVHAGDAIRTMSSQPVASATAPPASDGRVGRLEPRFLLPVAEVRQIA
jgi:hypothetical protein